MSGIPIGSIANVTPGVIGPSGGLNFLNGLVLTTNTSVPAGSVQAFSSLPAVGTTFGATSEEYKLAAVYFSGYTNSIQTPATLYFAGWTLNADIPTQMNAIVSQNQQWTGFTHAFQTALADKEAFATWTASQKNRFWYVCWDSDAQAVVGSATEPFGVWLKGQAISGTTVVYAGSAADPTPAALCLAWMASLNYGATNGRQTLAFVQNGLVTPTVTDGTSAANLLANGYGFYGAYAGATGSFVFMYPGSVSGQFLWADSYINQIWMNAEFQGDLISLFLSAGNIPFNTEGDALIEAALQDTVTQAIAFGAIRTGVTLSDVEAQEVNNAAGVKISDTLQTSGYYIQPGASTASATSRGNRTVPGAKIWYTDGQSVQSIALASVELV